MMWTEEVVAYFNVLLWHLPGVTEEHCGKEASLDSQPSGRELKSAFPEYAARVLTT
jgi:hypothetical protein